MSRPPQPIVLQQQASGQQSRPDGGRRDGVGFKHTPHASHAAKEDQCRYDCASLDALKLAVEARQPSDTDQKIVDRAKAFRTFLIETPGSR